MTTTAEQLAKAAQPAAPQRQVTPEHIMQLGLGFWASKAVLSAVELGLFSTLAGAPADLVALQKKLGLRHRSARDFLDTLVALKLLERENGVYRNSLEATCSSTGQSRRTSAGCSRWRMRASTAIGARSPKRCAPASSKTKPSTGTIFSAPSTPIPTPARILERDEAGSAPPRRRRSRRNFRGGSTRRSSTSGRSGHDSDHACASARSPARNRLRPAAVAPIFEEFVAHHGLWERVRFVAGNFFEDALPKADVIVMGHILHDWDLAQKKMLLEKAYAALPAGGALIVYEAMIDDERRENAFGLLMSLNMLIETPGGFDYTGADCQAWMHEAGFTKTRVEHLAGPDSMVVGIK